MAIRMPTGIFIDTGVFVAYALKKDQNHGRAVHTLSECMRGRHGTVFTSDFIYNEALTLALAITRQCNAALSVHKLIFGEQEELPRFIHMLNVDKTIQELAYSEFQTTCKDGLSFTDTTTLVLMKLQEIPKIATFDTHFQGRAIVIG
ncbi:MAG: type II toxin-antitoxin system VapC family toxin [Candidatus Heimdallarchaeota archaeon]